MIRHPIYAYYCSHADIWRGDCGPTPPPEHEGGQCYDFSHGAREELRVKRVIPLSVVPECNEFQDDMEPILDNDMLKYPWPLPPPIGMGCYELPWDITNDICTEYIVDPQNCIDFPYHPCCNGQETVIEVEMEYEDEDNCIPLVHMNIDPSLLGTGGGGFTMPRWGAGCVSNCEDVYVATGIVQPGGEIWDGDDALCMDLRDPGIAWCADKFQETGDSQAFEVFNSFGQSFTIGSKTWYDVMEDEEFEQTRLEYDTTGLCSPEFPGCPGSPDGECLCYKFKKMKRQVLLNRCCEEVFERWTEVLEGQPPEPVVVEEGFVCKEEDVAHSGSSSGYLPPQGINQIFVQIIGGCDTEIIITLDDIGLDKKYNKLISCDGTWEFIILEDVWWVKEGETQVILPGAICGCLPA